ncbi:Uncharacterised protein [Mycobacteroides abscessus subsp. abscessus]|nr:Uncharacterised protein [Mycobacteroides abscessus subsp. abscessus]
MYAMSSGSGACTETPAGSPTTHSSITRTGILDPARRWRNSPVVATAIGAASASMNSSRATGTAGSIGR